MYLVFDIGGTNTRIATSQDGQALGNQKTFFTPQDFEEGIELFQKTALELTKGERISVAAGAVRSPLNKNKSFFVNNSILPNWINQPLKERLQQSLSTSVFLENDAALAGLGEASFGAGKGYKIVAYITVSTGVGGARIVDGKVDTNSLGFEPGHQIIVMDGELCGCGGKGHLEGYISGSAIEKKFGQKPEDIKDPVVWDEVIKTLAVGLNNTIVHWSPDIIILGGGVTNSLPIEKVEEALKKTVTVFTKVPDIKKASLGDDSGLLGALKYINNNG
ncbi:MAG: ROK family protein [Candidatus Daviesbacteria bacterium]|nr:ROK family protein [Candidatus Daviesbacteria bacterium]